MRACCIDFSLMSDMAGFVEVTLGVLVVSLPLSLPGH
jgi:hypothetical protein